MDHTFYRPTEVDLPRADCRKAREKLGWSARIKCQALVGEMVESDCAL